jgi:hypothetical protein
LKELETVTALNLKCLTLKEKIHKMEAMKFDTMVGENGILKIPELKNYVNQNVEVFVVLNPATNQKREATNLSAFLEKWTGYFRETTTDDIKYNYLMNKHK